MHSAVWGELLRKIPANHHDNLRLVTSIGIEINISGIVRMEPEYLVLRGREAASTDANRVFFIPFDQINYVGFKRLVKEVEVRAMFGEIVSMVEKDDTLAAEAPVAEKQEPANAEAPAVEAKADAPPEAPPAQLDKEAAAAQMPGKAALLARLRNRVQAPAAPPGPAAGKQ
jgi:hypothetical protein